MKVVEIIDLQYSAENAEIFVTNLFLVFLREYYHSCE